MHLSCGINTLNMSVIWLTFWNLALKFPRRSQYPRSANFYEVWLLRQAHRRALCVYVCLISWYVSLSDCEGHRFFLSNLLPVSERLYEFWLMSSLVYFCSILIFGRNITSLILDVNCDYFVLFMSYVVIPSVHILESCLKCHYFNIGSECAYLITSQCILEEFWYSHIKCIFLFDTKVLVLVAQLCFWRNPANMLTLFGQF